MWDLRTAGRGSYTRTSSAERSPLQITPDTTIAAVVERWLDTARILVAYGLSCASSSISKGETIAQAVCGHGRGRLQMDTVMRRLNERADTGPRPRALGDPRC